MINIIKEQGDAGTGKTTTAAVKYSGALFCAPTNKATDVLNHKFSEFKRKGIISDYENAITLHRAIYYPKKVGKELVEVNETNPDGSFVRDTKGRICKRKKIRDIYEFVVCDKSPIMSYDLVVIDEASMIASTEAREIVNNYNGKIVLLGDEKQLPPVDNIMVDGFTNWFHNLPTTYTHTHNYRQEAGSNIITIAIQSYKRNALVASDADDCIVDTTNQYSIEDVVELYTYLSPTSRKILCFKNQTRTNINREIRKNIYGNMVSFDAPKKGEILIAEHKSKKYDLQKGSEYIVKDVDVDNKNIVTLSLEHVSTHNIISVQQNVGTFNNPDASKDYNALLSFSYATTVHKSQGSEWDDVLLIDDTYYKMPNKGNWYYTGLTRAAKRAFAIKI